MELRVCAPLKNLNWHNVNTWESWCQEISEIFLSRLAFFYTRNATGIIQSNIIPKAGVLKYYGRRTISHLIPFDRRHKFNPNLR